MIQNKIYLYINEQVNIWLSHIWLNFNHLDIAQEKTMQTIAGFNKENLKATETVEKIRLPSAEEIKAEKAWKFSYAWILTFTINKTFTFLELSTSIFQLINFAPIICLPTKVYYPSGFSAWSNKSLFMNQSRNHF